MDSSETVWLASGDLVRRGFEKKALKGDTHEARIHCLKRPVVRREIGKRFAACGLGAEFGSHNAMRSFSGGRKLMSVLGAVAWICPQVMCMDELTRYLNPEPLTALIDAFKMFVGSVSILRTTATTLSRSERSACSPLCFLFLLMITHRECAIGPQLGRRPHVVPAHQEDRGGGPIRCDEEQDRRDEAEEAEGVHGAQVARRGLVQTTGAYGRAGRVFVPSNSPVVSLWSRLRAIITRAVSISLCSICQYPVLELYCVPYST